MGRQTFQYFRPKCGIKLPYFRAYPEIFYRFQRLCQASACDWKQVIEHFMLNCIAEGKLPNPPKLPEDKLARIIVKLEKKSQDERIARLEERVK